MKYVFLGNFVLKGAGYTTIIEELAMGLTDRGHEVMVLGYGYDKSPHYFPFKLVPIERNWSVDVLKVIPQRWNPDRVFAVMDVNDLASIVMKFMRDKQESDLWNFEAIFPIESHPIREDWAFCLGKFKNRFVISDYGRKQCEAAGLPAMHLPMGCKPGKMPKSKRGPREKLGWPVDKTIFLTVASNQERKALPLAMQAFAMLPEDTHYYLLTDPNNKLGWRLDFLAKTFKIMDRFNIIQAGVDAGILSMMYWAADAFVLPSQAEGACLPIYEAAAHGLPVICGDWTGLEDVADEKWVMPIGYDYEYIFAWGNVRRWMASIDDLETWMRAVHEKRIPYQEMVKAARDFALSRPWSNAVDVIEQAAKTDSKVNTLKEAEVLSSEEMTEKADIRHVEVEEQSKKI